MIQKLGISKMPTLDLISFVEGFLDYRKDPETYVYAKIYDSLVEGKLTLGMLRCVGGC